MNDHRRLIEDYLPIEDIRAESSREKSIRKGHISTLHLWWARRALVACRAAVYAALMPAPRSKEQRDKEARFVKQLAKYPGSPTILTEARRRITEAHAKRTGSSDPPRILDFFAGGGNDSTRSSDRLTPVVYLRTRSVTCKNPSCGATVPLVR
jgi:putative DNA methylase